MKLEAFIKKVMTKARYNSDRTEFYCDYKVGKAQRELCEQIRDYTTVNIDGQVWYVKATFGWSEKQPVNIFGTCRP